MLEIYLLSLHKTIKGSLSIDEAGIRGQGATRVFNYLRAAGVAVSSVDLYSQVQAALQIRNCLLHAGGLLADSRNDKEIRRIVSDMTYLSTQSRKKDSIYKVGIGLSSFGEQIQITNNYSYLVSVYARDHFLSLCCKIDETFSSIP